MAHKYAELLSNNLHRFPDDIEWLPNIVYDCDMHPNHVLCLWGCRFVPSEEAGDTGSGCAECAPRQSELGGFPIKHEQSAVVCFCPHGGRCGDQVERLEALMRRALEAYDQTKPPHFCTVRAPIVSKHKEVSCPESFARTEHNCAIVTYPQSQDSKTLCPHVLNAKTAK